MPPKGEAKKDAGGKGDAKGAPGKGLASSTDIFAFLGGLLIFLSLGNAIMQQFSSGDGLGGWAGRVFSEFQDFYSAFKIVSFLMTVMLGATIAYFLSHINRIRAEERKDLYPEKEEKETERIMNRKWQRVIDHLESDNASDWKVAIIEADIILDEMLDAMGYHGDTVGDKLKQVEKSDFSSIDKAWEAHKVRNQIAHEGSEFTITKREAVRVVELYKDVFEEFYFI